MPYLNGRVIRYLKILFWLSGYKYFVNYTDIRKVYRLEILSEKWEDNFLNFAREFVSWLRLATLISPNVRKVLTTPVKITSPNVKKRSESTEGWKLKSPDNVSEEGIFSNPTPLYRHLDSPQLERWACLCVCIYHSYEKRIDLVQREKDWMRKRDRDRDRERETVKVKKRNKSRERTR